MFNPKAFEYMNCQFGDRINNYLYSGIYNNNILLVDINNVHLFGFDRPFPAKSSFRFSPTVNELKYIFSHLYNLPITKYFIPIIGIDIKEIITVDNIYYNPRSIKFMIYIKRIPIC